jgi:hypothetical protein
MSIAGLNLPQGLLSRVIPVFLFLVPVHYVVFDTFLHGTIELQNGFRALHKGNSFTEGLIPKSISRTVNWETDRVGDSLRFC